MRLNNDRTLRSLPTSRGGLAFALVVVVTALAGCGGGTGRAVQITGHTMGTTLLIRFLQPDNPLDTDWALNRVDDLLRDVNAGMSTYDPESELSHFNAQRSSAPFAVSTDTLRVFEIAQQVSALTDGAFDITVGPLVNAYGFGPESFDHRLPPEATIAALQKTIGYNLLEVDSDAGTISKRRPEVYCDLAGVAKGYGVDVVARWLEDQGVTDYMVEIGGEVRTRGRNPDGQWWRIGVERPDAEIGVVQRVVALRDMAVATSGDYRNFMMVDGQRISHTIDPRTGRPVRHNLASVTVLRETCAEADALATAFSVLGPETGVDLAEREGVAALFLVRLPDGAFAERETLAFQAYERSVGQQGSES